MHTFLYVIKNLKNYSLNLFDTLVYLTTENIVSPLYMNYKHQICKHMN